MSSSNRPPGDPGLNPADIAREAFRRLATRRVAPTPDAYREIYNEIAGTEALPPPVPASDPGPEHVLSGFAHKLADTPGELAEFGVRFNRAVKQRDWDGYARTLSQLAEKHLRRHTHPALSLGAEDGDAKLLRDLDGGAQRGRAAGDRDALERLVLPDRTEERRHGRAAGTAVAPL